jgi:hypothetical protein
MLTSGSVAKAASRASRSLHGNMLINSCGNSIPYPHFTAKVSQKISIFADKKKEKG